jgi:hypothetical protein
MTVEAELIKLAKEECANCDRNMCFPRDKECTPIFKDDNGSHICKFFKEAVLPLHPALQSALANQTYDNKLCAICWKPFMPGNNSQKLCPVCAEILKKQRHAKLIHRNRKQKDLAVTPTDLSE